MLLITMQTHTHQGDNSVDSRPPVSLHSPSTTLTHRGCLTAAGVCLPSLCPLRGPSGRLSTLQGSSDALLLGTLMKMSRQRSHLSRSGQRQQGHRTPPAICVHNKAKVTTAIRARAIPQGTAAEGRAAGYALSRRGSPCKKMPSSLNYLSQKC